MTIDRSEVSKAMDFDRMAKFYWSLQGFPRAFQLHILGTYNFRNSYLLIRRIFSLSP